MVPPHKGNMYRDKVMNEATNRAIPMLSEEKEKYRDKQIGF
jgi:hypothetical protein